VGQTRPLAIAQGLQVPIGHRALHLSGNSAAVESIAGSVQAGKDGDFRVLTLQPREKRYKVTDGDGLYLLVNPAGGKYWYMKYYLGGRPQEVVFGVYPNVSLKLAREKRLDARQQLARGLNPRLEKKKMRRAVSVLFERVVEEWLRMMSTPAKNGNDSAKA
jgi:hypothetical protein